MYELDFYLVFMHVDVFVRTPDPFNLYNSRQDIGTLMFVERILEATWKFLYSDFVSYLFIFLMRFQIKILEIILAFYQVMDKISHGLS